MVSKTHWRAGDRLSAGRSVQKTTPADEAWTGLRAGAEVIAIVAAVRHIRAHDRGDQSMRAIHPNASEGEIIQGLGLEDEEGTS
jgi:hypothetical protein